MLNGIFLFLVVGAVVTAAFTGTMPKVTTDAVGAAKTAVELAIMLIGQMALWLGFMRVLRDGGLLASLSRALAPAMRWLFPSVPADHPAMSAMIMNLGANVLGLGNAATPFGLKAMKELDRLNDRPGVATDAMALFLAINTSGVAVIPLQAIAARAALGSVRLGDIIIPSLIATSLSTLAAIVVTKWVERRPRFAADRYPVTPRDVMAASASPIAGLAEAEAIAAQERPWAQTRVIGAAVIISALAVAVIVHLVRLPPDQSFGGALRGVLADWLLPALMAAILLFGFAKRVKVYESFVEGAKEGFGIAVMVIPFLVAILVAIAMFRASGAMEVLIGGVAPLVSAVGFPPDALPMAFIRPLSGSGALAVMTEIMKTHGPDSFVGFVASVMYGSTETTFYVLAVYFGSVGVRTTRHTLIPCLAADLVGLTSAVYISYLFFG